MIIVSQNRMCLVNFNNTSVIYKDKDTRIVCDDMNGDLLCELGEYTTTQECDEVFERLISDIGYSFSENQLTVIYMPQRRGED